MQTLDFVSGLQTVSNSPNPSRVYIRLCKHGKRFLLLKYCIGSLFIKRPSKIWHILFNKDEYIYSKGNFLLHNTANSVPNINDGNKFATCKIKKRRIFIKPRNPWTKQNGKTKDRLIAGSSAVQQGCCHTTVVASLSAGIVQLYSGLVNRRIH